MTERPLTPALLAPPAEAVAGSAAESIELRALLDALPQCVALFDEKQRLRYSNRAWSERGLGACATDAASPDLGSADLGSADLGSADSGSAAATIPLPAEVSQVIARVLSGASEAVVVLERMRAGRGSDAYEIRARPVGGSWVLVSAHDISQHLRAERGHREAESLLAAILETADVGLCTIDHRGRFATVNRSYCVLFGYQMEELVGRLHTRVLPSEEHEHAQRLFARYISGQGANPTQQLSGSSTEGRLTSELRGRRKDGTPLDLFVATRLLIGADGRRFLVCSVIDVTDRKEKARELEERANSARADAAQKTLLLTELDRKLELIERQHQQIVDLSAPVLDLWDGILVLPIIGGLGAERAATITERLLHAVVERRARSVILDLTSARDLDGSSLEYLVRMIQAVRLLGARALLTGLSPSAAQVLVTRGVALDGVPALRSLAEGLRTCLASR